MKSEIQIEWFFECSQLLKVMSFHWLSEKWKFVFLNENENSVFSHLWISSLSRVGIFDRESTKKFLCWVFLEFHYSFIKECSQLREWRMFFALSCFENSLFKDNWIFLNCSWNWNVFFHRIMKILLLTQKRTFIFSNFIEFIGFFRKNFKFCSFFWIFWNEREIESSV